MTWLNDSLCKEMDVSFFSYIERDDPLYPEEYRNLPYSKDMEKTWNLERLERNSDYCYDCPVMAECYNSATNLEKFWTVRGGALPTVVSQGVHKRKTPYITIRDYIGDVCQRGIHSNWCVKSDGTRYCKDCADAAALALDERRARESEEDGSHLV